MDIMISKYPILNSALFKGKKIESQKKSINNAAVSSIHQSNATTKTVSVIQSERLYQRFQKLQLHCST
jgi:hypothetical protein